VLFHQYSIYINQTWFVIFKYDVFHEKILILIFYEKNRKFQFFPEKIPEIRGKPGKMLQTSQKLLNTPKVSKHIQKAQNQA
jgi:hypothetical protein